MIHLIKLSVGSKTIDDLDRWQKTPRAQTAAGEPRHVTRMFPKKEVELLSGGSIFWVIDGLIQCRQSILRLEEIIGEDGIRRCAIVLDPKLIPVHPTRKRPFQGWRYLAVDDAPMDTGVSKLQKQNLPKTLMVALDEIGVV